MSSESQESRLTKLEELVTHLERLVHELNGVVLTQQRHLESLGQQTIQLREEVGEITSGSPQPRKLEDEKPPHY